MSKGNAADGFNKSRLVLGDVTNRIGKRGFSEREKSVVKSYLNENDTIKHVRVSSRKCNEVDLLKGKVLSRISNISNENKFLNPQDLGSSFAVSERSIDAGLELASAQEFSVKDAEKLSGENARDAKSQQVNAMFTVDNGSLTNVGNIASYVEDAITKMDKMGSRNSKDPSLTDLEVHRVIDPIVAESGGCVALGSLCSLEDDIVFKIHNAVTENTTPNLTSTVKNNVVDATRYFSGNVALSGTKISKSSYLNMLDLRGGDVHQSPNIKAKNKSGSTAPVSTSSKVSETDSDCLLDGSICDAGEANVSLAGTQKTGIGYLNEVEGHDGDNFIMSQSDSIDCAILPESQESRIFGVGKFSEPKKGKECAYAGSGADTIKTCSCSFCSKAAYIWLDLNYQDIKGRVTAMKKSQKEASILAESFRVTKDNDKHNAEESTKISKLEIDLIHQWKFLFQHTAGMWEQESDHLETSLLPMTDLRDKFKRDLGSD